jgi:hypothetical protein
MAESTTRGKETLVKTTHVNVPSTCPVTNGRLKVMIK